MRNLNNVLYLALFTLLSCAHYAYKDSYKLLKGMSAEQVSEAINSGPLNEFEMNKPDNVSRSYFIQVYTEYRGQYHNYLITVFRDNNLYYWGYPYELNRSFDNDMNAIGRKVTKSLYRDAED